MRKNRDLNADLISARESRKDAFVALHAMNDKARDEKRDLTDTEKNEFERLTGDVRLFDNELRRIETIMGVGDHQDARRGNDGNVNDLARRCSLFRAIRHLMNDGNADAGAELEWQQEQLRTMPRTIKGMLFPLREQRALATATGETGGYLVEEELRDDLYIGPLRDRRSNDLANQP